MTTLTITTPTNKPGELAYFQIEFKNSDFLEVIEAVENLKSPSEVLEIKLWKVK